MLCIGNESEVIPLAKSGKSSGIGRNAKPEHFSTEMTINGRSYKIENGKIIRNGNSIEAEPLKEITDKSLMKKAKDAGLVDPVSSGSTLTERKVVEKALEQKAKASENYQSNLKKNVPGLSELRNAIFSNEREYEAQRSSIYSGSGRVHQAKTIDLSGLKKQYPRAALYVTAEGYANASNYKKMAAGREAMEIIRTGGSLKKAKKCLENWLTR